jgi:hypothetical protein
MHRALVTGLLAAVIAIGLVVWRSAALPGILPLAVAAVIAGLPAAAITIMRESVIEDLLKACLAIVLGALLLWQGVPVWVAWPVMVGPFVGMLGVNRVREKGGGRPEEG